MRRILLAEDEKMIRYGIYVMIENSGVPYSEITECRNGRDAVEQLKKNRYDLVLTDIRMPFMGGLELAAWIRDNLEEEERPFLAAISGYAEFEYVKGMLQFQAMDYLLKPVDREELGKVLWHAEELVRRKRGDAQWEEKEEQNTGDVTGMSRRKMQEALDYIRKNYARPIDMAEVSNHVAMNYSMFSTTFKEYTGENFSTCLRRFRIEKSIKLLQNTVLTVGEISRRVGFIDAKHFARVFKEETGKTPIACRNEGITEKK